MFNFETGEFCAPGLCSISMGSGGGSNSSSSSKTKFNRGFLTQLEDYAPAPLYSNQFEGVRIEDMPATFNAKGKMPTGKRAQLEAVLDEDGNPTYDEAGNPITRPMVNDNGGFPSSYQRQQFNIGVPQFHGLEDMDFENLQKNLYGRQLQEITPTYETERNRRREELSQTGLINSPIQFAEGGALDSLERNYLDQSQKAASEAVIQRTELEQEELARKLGFDVEMVKLFENIFSNRASIALAASKQASSKSESDGGFKFGIGL